MHRRALSGEQIFTISRVLITVHFTCGSISFVFSRVIIKSICLSTVIESARSSIKTGADVSLRKVLSIAQIRTRQDEGSHRFAVPRRSGRVCRDRDGISSSGHHALP